MKPPVFGRYALICSVAMFAGCGGSQPPVGAPGSVSQTPSSARHGKQGRSWMLPEAKRERLVYVANNNDTITVYSYKSRSWVGTITTPNEFLQGMCVDGKGNVYATFFTSNKIVEYPHGSVLPIKTLNDPGYPWDCAIDPATGDLAVTNGGNEATGSVLVYKDAKGTPVEYTDSGSDPIWGFFYCTYDDEGNLFADGVTGGGSQFSAGLAELPKGGTALMNISLVHNGPYDLPGGLQWDGKYLTYAVYGDQNIYQLTVSGGKSSQSGVTYLNQAQLNQYWIHPQNTGRHQAVIGVSSDDNPSIEYWDYPAGGDPIATITQGVYEPNGVVLSPIK
jgi:hypothetical protein